MTFALRFLWYFWTTILLIPAALVSTRAKNLMMRQWARCCELEP
jgi:hypothetical protein